MINQLYQVYGRRYENLVYDVFMFFIDRSTSSKYGKQLINASIRESLNYKCVMDFVLSNDKIYRRDGSPIQPADVDNICHALSNANLLSRVEIPFNRNVDGMFNFYFGYDRGLNKIPKEILITRLNSIVYGFQYIYENFKKYVFQITVKNDEGKEGSGTCFLTVAGLVTARHCLEDFDHFSVDGGVTFNEINKTEIIYHDKADIALISPHHHGLGTGFIFGKELVLSNVIAMGYPRVSGFSNFLNGTVGTVTSIERSYLTGIDLMLITCPVRGGNSGGPLINEYGEVVGVITDLPYSENNEIYYDNFGYGIATPIKYLQDII
ncbi:MAG: trypsin-like peptidase domain-containing protein [Candidatus Izemoplasmatales bacterium]|nr:trypsin-like peptidase domain-containing protein [Candidatus Izemoplasmatales bacterium]